MALQKLYRKPGKKYRTELRPSRIDILILPLVVCFLLSIVVWCYATGHKRPEEVPPTDTNPPYEETTSDDGNATEDGTASDAPAESLPADGEAQPSDV